MCPYWFEFTWDFLHTHAAYVICSQTDGGVIICSIPADCISGSQGHTWVFPVTRLTSTMHACNCLVIPISSSDMPVPATGSAEAGGGMVIHMRLLVKRLRRNFTSFILGSVYTVRLILINLLIYLTIESMKSLHLLRAHSEILSVTLSCPSLEFY